MKTRTPKPWELAALVRKWRLDWGMTQPEAAEWLGIPRRTLENIEQGKPYSYSRVLALAVIKAAEYPHYDILKDYRYPKDMSVGPIATIEHDKKVETMRKYREAGLTVREAQKKMGITEYLADLLNWEIADPDAYAEWRKRAKMRQKNLA